MFSFSSAMALLAQAPLLNQPDLPFYQQGWFLWIIAIAVVVLPFMAGAWLSRVWRMPEHSFKFGITLFALVAGIVICTLKWKDLRLGIDLSGGVILIYELEDTKSARSTSVPASRGSSATWNRKVSMPALLVMKAIKLSSSWLSRARTPSMRLKKLSTTRSGSINSRSRALVPPGVPTIARSCSSRAWR